jgi:hypothetical protein
MLFIGGKSMAEIMYDIPIGKAVTPQEFTGLRADQCSLCDLFNPDVLACNHFACQAEKRADGKNVQYRAVNYPAQGK